MMELMFLKELILITQVNQKSVIATIWYFLNKKFKFHSYVWNKTWWQDLLMMLINLSNIAILKTKNADYCCIISEIRKSEAIKLLRNIDLTEKSGKLQKNKYQEQFWSYKFTRNSNLNKKVESYKLKKIKFQNHI